MKQDRYSMSFTTGGLLYQESMKLAVLFLESKDWNLVRDKALSNNLLQARTLNTSQRVCREIISRLKTLNPLELKFLVQSNAQEQGYILWMAFCRRYAFVGDFATKVLRERYISLKTDLHQEDYDFFFHKTSELHPEFDEISQATRMKLRQVLFRILREADLLTADNTIKAALLSPRLLAVLPHDHRRDVIFFPVFESDLEWNNDEVGS